MNKDALQKINVQTNVQTFCLQTLFVSETIGIGNEWMNSFVYLFIMKLIYGVVVKTNFLEIAFLYLVGTVLKLVFKLQVT